MGPIRALAACLAVLGVCAAPAAARPDPLLGSQWALDQPTLGVPDAWTQSTGSGVLVAVLDTGIQLDHPDLRQRIWTNPGEVPDNGIDDDHNGIVDDVHGANLLNLSNDVTDGEGHGTHVAGIIAAQARNGIGVSGEAPDARILPVKVLDDQDHGRSVILAAGIRYAVAEGARIINVSVNGDALNGQLQSAVADAVAAGATIVASAGNDGRDIDVIPSFPASYPGSGVVTVAALNAEGHIWPSSNTGVHSVDLAAPGSDVLSTTIGSAYENRSGTSMAAPLVSGALALLASARPDLPQAFLRGILFATARRAPDLKGVVGWGALDVGAAMHLALPGALWHVTVHLKGPHRLRAGHHATLRWRTTGARGVARWRVTLDGRFVASIRKHRSRRARIRLPQRGLHRVQVVGLDASGEVIAHAARRIRVIR